MLVAVATALLLLGNATLPGQVAPSAESIAAKMAENLERATDARRLYIYDKDASTGLWKHGVGISSRVARYDHRRYVSTGAYGQVIAADGFQGECQNSMGVQSYGDIGFSCRGLEQVTEKVERVIAGLLDDGRSLDGLPYWLLPFRPAYLRFFQFKLKGMGDFHGRSVYIISFKPRRGNSAHLPVGDPHHDARPWEGTMWVDAEEGQLARVAARQSNPGGLFSISFFQIEYTRVSKDVWFPASSCNALSGGRVGARVSFQNTSFREMDVRSQMEYVSSLIRYH
jgi:hypothetical protein